MKSSAPIINALVLLFGSVSSVFAASGAREDNSGIFVWIFLGFCALIVVLQLVPAVLMMLGMAKGLKRESPQEQKATH
ncbi:hypothetical protein [Geobacter grbiciae]|uniref:hypothetical protein n=1 Tax=Geobacter grbiciae TaxID=155042 RepID=UPI001C016555|nr:hypothetical protein [Geobacter grbiciae]MBT1075011.1 hypothetical protein [Geobacter grbiciae]